MKFLLAFALGLLLASSALAQQTLLQAGPNAPGHVPQYIGGFGNSQPIVQDGGGAGGGPPGTNPNEIGITVRSPVNSYPAANAGNGPYGTNFCDYDAPTTNATGYHYLCLDADAQGGGLLTYGAGGGASQLPLSFIINGITYPVPGTQTTGYGPGVAALLAGTASGSGGPVGSISPTFTGEVLVGVAGQATPGVINSYGSGTDSLVFVGYGAGSAASLSTDPVSIYLADFSTSHSALLDFQAVNGASVLKDTAFAINPGFQYWDAGHENSDMDFNGYINGTYQGLVGINGGCLAAYNNTGIGGEPACTVNQRASLSPVTPGGIDIGLAGQPWGYGWFQQTISAESPIANGPSLDVSRQTGVAVLTGSYIAFATVSAAFTVAVSDDSQGDIGIYTCYGGACSFVAGSSPFATFVTSTTSPATSKSSVAYDSVSGTYRIYNGFAATHTYKAAVTRLN